VKVGILGAGQLARMMILNSKHLGLDFVLFCAEITPVTANLAEHVVASFADYVALEKFCHAVDVVTFESENIESATLDFVLRHKNIYPPKEILLTAQDRLLEKQLFNSLNIATNNYMPIESYSDAVTAAEKFGLPLILKSRRLGYDGKNQYHIKTADQLAALQNVNLVNFIAESFVPFSYEVSIIGVRNAAGEIRCYDLCCNVHEAGILRSTKNIVDAELFAAAQTNLHKIMQHFNYVGVLAIEFFVQDGALLANEMAPRVHNSGHWTIEGARVSQFENHIRAIAALPLGDVSSIVRCEMQNCIGTMPERNAVLQRGGFYHNYQKEPLPGRKLGHVVYIL
jgi:5-(carboxyamino)imidazole ribonucleotide synthase